MKEKQPTADEWRALYEQMDAIKKLSPWEWMEEGDIFGVQDPDTGELGFVSVMGSGGEHFAIGVYLGVKALYRFWYIQELPNPEMLPQFLMETEQLQAAFEDRNELDEADREQIKALGLKYRGRKAWPAFRSYRPGFAPWYLNAAEARFMTHILAQTIHVAERFRDDPDQFDLPSEDAMFMRVPKRQGTAITWRDEWQNIVPPDPDILEIEVRSDRSLDEFRQVKALEVDVNMMLMMPVQEEKGTRPRYPYLLMIVEPKSGFILASEMLTVETTLNEMWGKLPNTVLSVLSKANILPQEFWVRSPLLASLLQTLADLWGGKVKQKRRLKAMDAAQSVLARFGGGMDPF